ncbi:MAG: hypothetical protein J4F48_09090, partial [Nitrospinae bacterium]|nr:hypothetical protein [Nitrospinota bacterium]
ERINKNDAKTYRDLHVKFTEGMLDIITSFMYCAPLPPEELKERFAGPLGREFLSYANLSMYEAVDQHFEDDRLRVLFKLFLGSFTLENTPTTGIFFPRIFSRIASFALPVGGRWSAWSCEAAARCLPTPMSARSRSKAGTRPASFWKTEPASKPPSSWRAG